MVYNLARAQNTAKGMKMGLSSKSSSRKSAPSVTQTTQSAASTPMSVPAVTTTVTDVFTPAVARDISADTEAAQQNQKLARSRLSGIRSTWSTFGAESKLGS